MSGVSSWYGQFQMNRVFDQFLDACNSQEYDTNLST